MLRPHCPGLSTLVVARSCRVLATLTLMLTAVRCGDGRSTNPSPSPQPATATPTPTATVAVVTMTVSATATATAVPPSPPSSATLNPTPTAALPTVTPVPADTQTPAPAPQFTAAILSVSAAQRSAMLASGSWRQGCPVAIDDLRVIAMNFWGFDGELHQGLLMVNADVAQDVVTAFRLLFEAEFPIHRMELVDGYGADDEQSMLADNTSAYNCRGIPGSSAWSQHAYGRAIDLNPFENPEVRNGAVDPPEAARYANRLLRDQGMIFAGDAATSAFAALGWTWGGSWPDLQDYQHFSLTGN